jgi:hypothetical protein
MPSNLEKEKRNALKKSYKANEKLRVLASLPVSVEKLKELFNWLDNQSDDYHCDDTLKQTRIFIEQNNLPKEILIEWLENQGG